MRRQPDPPFQPGQPQFSANARCQPRIRRWQLRPASLIQASEDHQVSSLQSRLKQSPDENAVMPAIGRADGDGIEQVADHVGCVIKGQPFRPAARIILNLINQV